MKPQTQCVADLHFPQFYQGNHQKMNNKRERLSDCTQRLVKQKTSSARPDCEESWICAAVFRSNDILPIVLSFLDVRSVYNMSRTYKGVTQSLRSDNLVRSAAYDHDDKARRNLEQIIHRIQHGQIWTPSPQRLLRLLNARRCESCCEKSRGRLSVVFGVVLCWKCRCVKHGVRLEDFPDGVPGQLIVDRGFFYSSLWKDSYHDSSGELCGPIISFVDMCGRSSMEEAIRRKVFEYEQKDIWRRHREPMIQSFEKHYYAGQKWACLEYLKRKRLDSSKKIKLVEGPLVMQSEVSVGTRC